MSLVVVVKNPPCNAGDVGSITSQGTRSRICKCVSVCSVLSDSFVTPMGCSLPGSSVLGILQQRILEQVAISCSRGSSWFRDRTWLSCVSCIGGWVLYRLSHLGRRPQQRDSPQQNPEKCWATLLGGVVLRSQCTCRHWRHSRHPMCGSQHSPHGYELNTVLPTASTVPGSSWTRLPRMLTSMGSHSVPYPTVCLFFKMCFCAKQKQKQKTDRPFQLIFHLM